MTKISNRKLTAQILLALLAGGAILAAPQLSRAAQVTISSDAEVIAGSDLKIVGDHVYINGAAGNLLILDGPLNQLNKYFSGAYANTTGTTLHGNQVIVNNGTLNSISGAYSQYDNVTGNSVIVNGGSINENVYGGYSYYGGAVLDNVVIISGGSISEDVLGGRSSEGNAIGNNVNVSDGSISGNVLGGFSAEGNAVGNSVTISGGSISNDVLGGHSIEGNTIGNSVTINDGPISGDVYGSFSADGNAVGNSVTISGGSISGDVLGGYSYDSCAVLDNVVTISGGAVTGTVYGYGSSGGNPSAATGNTLNLQGANLSLGNIANFNNINFQLPSAATNDATIANLTNNSRGTDISNTAVKIALRGNSQLKIGDTVNLLAGSGTITDTSTVYDPIAIEGISRQFTLDFANTGDKLTATVAGIGLHEQTKSLVETRAAGIAVLNSGTDMLTGAGLDNAKTAAKAEPGSFVPFAVLSGNDMRYDSGSYIDVQGYGLGVGIARLLPTTGGELTYGLAVTYGKSDYDSYLDSGIHGYGDAAYRGLSLIARQDKTSGRYIEGSVGFGRVEADYASQMMKGADHVSYDSHAGYYALHAGLGKISQLTDNQTIDIYGKYYYSRLGSDQAELSNGESYQFHSVDSNRVRIGARYANQYKPKSQLYCGVAWEYEFSGSARASYKGYNTLSPSLRGGSAMLEAGWKIKPEENSPIELDLSINGWTGKKAGYSVGAQVNFQL